MLLKIDVKTQNPAADEMGWSFSAFLPFLSQPYILIPQLRDFPVLGSSSAESAKEDSAEVWCGSSQNPGCAAGFRLLHQPRGSGAALHRCAEPLRGKTDLTKDWIPQKSNKGDWTMAILGIFHLERVKKAMDLVRLLHNLWVLTFSMANTALDAYFWWLRSPCSNGFRLTEPAAFVVSVWGFQTQLGDKHPDTMHCKMLLAETKLSLGNRTEAKEEFEDLFLVLGIAGS